MTLSISASLTELVGTALRLLLPPLLLFALVLTIAWGLGPREPAPRPLRLRTKITLAIPLATAFFLGPNFPVGLINTLCALASGWLLGGGVLHRRGVRAILLPAAILVAGSVATGALSLRFPATDIGFAAGAPLPSGEYTVLGDADGFIYLRPCGGTDPRVVAVASTLVQSEAPRAEPPGHLGTLIEVALGRASPTLGARYEC